MTEKYPAMDVDIIVNGLCKSLIIELSSYEKYKCFNLVFLSRSGNCDQFNRLDCDNNKGYQRINSQSDGSPGFESFNFYQPDTHCKELI